MSTSFGLHANPTNGGSDAGHRPDLLFVKCRERAPATIASATPISGAGARGDQRAASVATTITVTPSTSGAGRTSPSRSTTARKLRQGGPGRPRGRRVHAQNDVHLRDQHHAADPAGKPRDHSVRHPRDVPPQAHHAEGHHDHRRDNGNFGRAAEPLILDRQRDERYGGAGRAADQHGIAPQQRDDRAPSGWT